MILDQGKTIKAMEKKMTTITETVDKQGGQLLAMQERMTDMENIIHGQEQEIMNLKHERDVLIDTIMDQRAEMDSMGKDMMKTIDAVRKTEEANIINNSDKKKGKENGNTFGIHRTIENNVLAGGIRKNSKTKNNMAAMETGYRVSADNKVEYSISKDRNQNGVDRPQSGMIGNGFDRVQKRSVTHVAFSTYLSHSLSQLSIGHMIKLDQISLNDGNGYNKYTGVFSVPASGVYLLTYSIETLTPNHYLEVELVVDNQNMGTSLAKQSKSASKTIITRLTAGQSVWLETAYYANAGIASDNNNKFTTFSGVLLY